MKAQKGFRRFRIRGGDKRQAFKIRTRIHAPRALDLLVRTPEYIVQQLADVEPKS